MLRNVELNERQIDRNSCDMMVCIQRKSGKKLTFDPNDEFTYNYTVNVLDGHK